MEKRPLVSVFITYYNTGDIVYETIDSVLSQDYPNIELIISDDGSQRVPMGDVAAYVEGRKRENITHLLVRTNEQNMGTVKHVELIRELCTGEYCCGIAGDDLFYDDHVISAMVECFEQHGESAQYMIAQVEMFDQNMENSAGYCVSNAAIELLQREDWEELLNLQAEGCQLVGQNMARTSFFREAPKMSKKYALVEDYSLHMWMLHHHIPITWCDIVMIKHRGGGLSHGNLANKPEIYAQYCRDYMTVFETEIKPYRREIDNDSYVHSIEAYRFFAYQYTNAMIMAQNPLIAKLLLARTPDQLASRMQKIKKLISPEMIKTAGKLELALLALWILLQLVPQQTAMTAILNAVLTVGICGAALLLAGILCLRGCKLLYKLGKLAKRKYV